ncbi:MAG TPA: radical SAM protein [Nitrososphaeraceae archaeon]|nr:radical SAM protein [Nitrososphaeraceae archaeon]
MELNYDYPLYRPPSEANSMIFQVTLGCSFNKCSFCNMYRTKDYSERPWEEIKMEIDISSKYYPETTRIFLADGDALNLSVERLTQILDYLYQKFPSLERVSSYAMPKNLLQKSDSELQLLKKAGLNMFYVGIESGNDIVLKKVTKGATYKSIVESCNKARNNDFILSCMVILGLGGTTYTKDHIEDTAKILGEISPDYVGALNLHLEDGVYEEFMAKYNEPFTFLDDIQVLDELDRLISNINPFRPIIFRANHASNVYSIKGILPENKEDILNLIRNLKNHPEMLKPKILRRF